MNVDHLRTFLAVQKHLNYTRAARELLLTQPAVSRQMRALEADLGVVLFKYVGKSLHLTASGSVLTGEAERILGDLERAREAVRAHGSLEGGSLRVGASTTPGLYVLPGVLGDFRRKHPSLDMRVVIGNSRLIEQRIIANEVDLALVGVSLRNKAIREEPLMCDEIVLFSAPGHPMARRRGLSLKELAGATWIVREPGSATRQLFDKWFAHGGGVMKRTIEVQSPEGVKALVAAGLGVSYMSAYGIAEEVRRRQLVTLKTDKKAIARRWIYLARHHHKYLSPVEDAFIELLRRHQTRSKPRRAGAFESR